MVRETVPESVSRLFWDVDPASIDLDRDRAFGFVRAEHAHEAREQEPCTHASQPCVSMRCQRAQREASSPESCPRHARPW